MNRDEEPLTSPTDPDNRTGSDQILSFLLTADEQVDAMQGGRYVAPIVVDGHMLGSIAIESPSGGSLPALSHDNLMTIGSKLGLPEAQLEQLVGTIDQHTSANHAAGVQFLYLLAASINRLCGKDYELARRAEELSTLYKLSTMLAGFRSVESMLDAAVETIATVIKVKAASIRLLDNANRQLSPCAVYGLSDAYINKGPIVVDRSDLFTRSLGGEVITVDDVCSDPRVLYPDYAKTEGLVSMMVTGLISRNKPIGTIQLFTDHPRRFTRHEIDLLRAASQLLAAAIVNARLDKARRDAERVQRQVRLAADVQKRMLPATLPELSPFDVAARYVPSTELGGDFYDFIHLESNLGLCIGDVVGKGIAASLLMASVRASLRAYAQDVYDLDEVISRVNVALTRDTLDNEFATLFYGVLDPETKRLTFCNAGHEAPLLLRAGKFVPLETGGMIVGIDAEQQYEKGIIDLCEDDLLLFYTDGLCDALNFQQNRFGRDRIMQAMRDVATGTTAYDAMSHILWEMRRFAGLNERADDTTLVALRVK